ncbi:zinc finger CONSTANS-like protein [Rhynchospora pubera]|uniref:Zinc finger CONSTANS-like protein n=1 Tax=Rhynchospora pubera TaxID=906938 RepID=A0AAV8D5F8_9POAL|nr:zinc finger CONSTANS-like protein [Rhynchospora pubera]
MTKEISMASTLGARTARPCDSCMRRRARVYCAADDAFLCAPCDSSVHSANPLARRHHRVPISPPPADSNPFPFMSPSWNKRKPRTPRQKPNALKPEPLHDHVPDLYETQNSEEDLSEENEQLLYQVPVFDPELADLYSPVPATVVEETKQVFCNSVIKSPPVDGLAGFQISDMDLEEFAADMENLLGGPEFDGLEGLMEIDAEADVEIFRDSKDNIVERAEKKRHKLILNLNYEGVIAAWGCQGSSPWTNGERPRLGPDDCWPDFKGISGGSSDVVGPIYKATLTSEGREARVSRYREKRRTRLFAKKIRYEVRKLNAEKRPRMKGRFIKRTNLASCQSVPTMKMPMQLPRPVVPGSFSY